MKYLKVYEDWKKPNEKLYTNLYEEDAREFINKNKKSEFTEKEISEIKDVLWQWHGNNKIFKVFYNDGILLIRKESKNRMNVHMYITSYEDEYYFVQYNFNIQHSYRRYYLCDQFDGLLDFIDDLSQGKVVL